MNISELLNSTYTLGKDRQPHFVFSSKPFGRVYAFNKEIKYKANYSIVEISMYISAVTQVDRTAHRVRIALKGVDIQEYTKEELIKKIRKLKTAYHKRDVDIIEMINNEVELIPGKFILPANKGGTKYLAVDKQIKLNTELRVDCSCADYYYTFAWYNCDHKVAIAPRPPAYKPHRGKERLTPQRNPKKKAGCCKHLLLLIAMLMEGGLLNNSKKLMSSYDKYSGNFEVVSRRDITEMVKKLQMELKEFKETEKLQRKENKEYTEAEKLRARMVY